MNKERTKRLALQAVPIGAFALFLFQEYDQHSLKVWILTDVLILTFGMGALTDGIFTRQIESYNQAITDSGKSLPTLGKSWLFVGLLFGGLTAGFLGQIVSSFATAPGAETFGLFIIDTFDAGAIIAFVFVTKYYPKKSKKGKGNKDESGDFFLDG